MGQFCWYETKEVLKDLTPILPLLADPELHDKIYDNLVVQLNCTSHASIRSFHPETLITNIALNQWQIAGKILKIREKELYGLSSVLRV